MEADACACLEDIDDELAIPLALYDLLGGGDDRVSDLGINESKLFIGLSRGPLDHGNGANQRGMRSHSRNRIVFNRTCGLDAVINVGGNLFWTDGIFLETGSCRRGRGHGLLLNQ